MFIFFFCSKNGVIVEQGTLLIASPLSSRPTNGREGSCGKLRSLCDISGFPVNSRKLFCDIVISQVYFGEMKNLFEVFKKTKREKRQEDAQAAFDSFFGDASNLNDEGRYVGLLVWWKQYSTDQTIPILVNELAMIRRLFLQHPFDQQMQRIFLQTFRAYQKLHKAQKDLPLFDGNELRSCYWLCKSVEQHLAGQISENEYREILFTPSLRIPSQYLR